MIGIVKLFELLLVLFMVNNVKYILTGVEALSKSKGKIDDITIKAF